jgi:hypothetical protein
MTAGTADLLAGFAKHATLAGIGFFLEAIPAKGTAIKFFFFSFHNAIPRAWRR